jgi:hypothetical protein
VISLLQSVGEFQDSVMVWRVRLGTTRLRAARQMVQGDFSDASEKAATASAAIQSLNRLLTMSIPFRSGSCLSAVQFAGIMKYDAKRGVVFACLRESGYRCAILGSPCG